MTNKNVMKFLHPANSAFAFSFVCSILLLSALQLEAQCPRQLSIEIVNQTPVSGTTFYTIKATNYSSYFGEIYWYEDENGSPVQTNYVDAYSPGDIISATFSITVLATRTIYVSFWNAIENCESEKFSIILQGSEPPNITGEYARICSDNIMDFKLTGGGQGAVYMVFELVGANNYNSLGSSATGIFNIPVESLTSFSGSVTLYVKIEGMTFYQPFYIQQDIPPLPSISDVVLCVNNSVVLTPQIGSPSRNWYNQWDNLISQDNNYTTEIFTQPGTYSYAVAGVSYNGCEGPRKTVQVRVDPKAADGSIYASKTIICLGQSVTIGSTGGIGAPSYWCSNNGGQSWNVFNNAYQGQSSFTHTPGSVGTYRYHLRNSTACGSCLDNNECLTNSYVDVVVHDSPECSESTCLKNFTVTQVSPSVICGTGTAVLSAHNNSLYEGEFRWYNHNNQLLQSDYVDGYSPYPGNILTSELVYNVSSNSNKTVYISFYNTVEGCESQKFPFQINYSPVFNLITEYARVCSDNIVRLKLSGGNANTVYNVFELVNNSYRYLQSGTGEIEIPTSGLTSFNGSVTLYAKVNGVCGGESYTSIYVQQDIPSLPVISGKIICTNNAITLIPQIDRLTCNWYDHLGVLVFEGKDFTTPVFTNAGMYSYEVATVGYNGCEGPRKTVTVTVEPSPVNGNISANPMYACPGEPVTISTTSGVGQPHYWCSNDGGNSWNVFQDAFVNESSFSFTPPAMGSYRVLVRNQTGCGFCTQCEDSYVDISVLNRIECQNVNYFASIEAQVSQASFSEADLLNNQKVVKTIAYIDGLGYPAQNVIYQGSPAGKDIIQPVFFDSYQRESKKYSPFTDGDMGFMKKTSEIIDAVSNNYIGVAHTFYDNQSDNIADDSKPYAETVYEASPLNRVTKQGAMGALWQPILPPDDYADNTIKFKYLLNEVNEVVRFRYNDTGLLSLAEGQSKYYPAHCLAKKVTADEFNNEVVEYVDSEGRIILKKAQHGSKNGLKQYALTYYIYDDFGNLAIVLPPEAVTKMEALINQQ